MSFRFSPSASAVVCSYVLTAQPYKVPVMNRQTAGTILAAVAAAAGIAAIITRPFLCAPIGLLCLLAAAKLTADRRFTAPATAILAVGALAGAAVAVGFMKPLY
jgi:hypothetical protein